MKTLAALALVPNLALALSLPVAEDTCIQSKRISSISAAASSLSVDSSSTPILFFSLDKIPEGSVARFAHLRLFLSSVRAKGDGIRLHRVTGAWDESKPGEAPAIDPNPIASVSSSEIASKRFVTFNVTDTLNQWLDGSLPNEGFAVLAGAGTRLSTPSKEGILTGLPATLEVEILGGDSSNGEGSGTELLTSPQATKIIGDTLQNLITPKLSAPLALSSQGSIPLIGVTAVGLGNLTYAWKRNGIPQNHLEQPQIRRPGLAGGTFQVTVSNSLASVQSGTLWIPDNGHEWVDLPGKNFSLSKYETSLSQWKAFVAETGYSASQQWANPVSTHDGSPFTQTDFEPVVCVSKADAELYCSWLSQKTGRLCRLPSDSEWTAAAGSSLYPWGDTFPPTQDSGNFSPGFHGGNDPAIDGFRFTSPVGSFKPSSCGLYDLGGNVWEWTSNGNIRGGSWENFAVDLLQSTAVVEHEASDRHPCIGFRVAVGTLSPTTSSGLTLRADIDHESILEISPNGLRWEHVSGNRPGTLDGTGYVATQVDGIDWWATWPSNSDNGSSGFSEYAPFKTKYFSGPVQVTVLSSRSGSNLAEILQQPAASNNFTLRIMLKDYDGSSAWHELRISEEIN